MAPEPPLQHRIRWRRALAPSQMGTDGLAARAALIERVTGEHYDLQSLRNLPYESAKGSFELHVGQEHPAGLLWTTRVTESRVRVLIFAIASKYQARGLGSQAWGMMQDDLTAFGITTVQLEVHASNQGALRLYRRLGLAPVGLIRGYYATGDGVLMEWVGSR